MRHVGFTLFFVLLFAGCAHTPLRKLTPRTALNEACAIGHGVIDAQGAVWMKVASDDVSGQFPANVHAQEPDMLDLEVTNLLGGTEAMVTVRGARYRIVRKGKESRTWQGTGTWSGIPLRWSSELFLGRIPCPVSRELAKARFSIEDDERLRVDVGTETYVYKIREWAGKAWAHQLEWMKKGAPETALHFEFDDPEDRTGSPLDWTVKSKRGEVRVRWKKGQRETKSGS